jgi:hypothetical protein
MKKTVLLTMIAITVILSATVVLARQLPSITNVDKIMFKNLVQGYFHPSITGWGIGLNTQQDSYLVAKFHAVTVTTLSRNQVLQILKDAKSGNATDWSDVRDRIRDALDANGTTIAKGMIQINKESYILTGMVKTETTFNGTIRAKPDYSACVSANISTEDCESQSTKIGDLSLTRKTAELDQSKDRVWAGTMNFNSTAYTFVALVNPRVGD